MKNKKRILYSYPHSSTFIQRDIELLATKHIVRTYEFNVQKKWLVPYQFVRQGFFLLRILGKTDVIFCHFAGYASFLPVLFGRIFNIPCFIIVAGTDGSRFPRFNYGNFTRKLLGFFTGISLRLARHILPVHESLVYQEYSYYEDGMPAQGYRCFFPKAGNTPFTPIYYGFDSAFFKPQKTVQRRSNSFISIGNLNDKYAFKRKGFDLIIELARMRPDLNFTFVGWDGRKTIDLPPNVELLRFMPITEIIAQFSRHEYYFQISIMEGFPNALAEAMLCGCVPIGSNVSGIPFIIGNTGYLLPQRDIFKLNNLIEQALTDPQREQLSNEARERIRSNFTIERRLEELEKIMDLYLR